MTLSHVAIKLHGKYLYSFTKPGLFSKGHVSWTEEISQAKRFEVYTAWDPPFYPSETLLTAYHLVKKLCCRCCPVEPEVVILNVEVTEQPTPGDLKPLRLGPFGEVFRRG